MTERVNAADLQMRALAQLRTLKAFLEDPKTPSRVSADFVNQFENALKQLNESGEDIKEFHFPRQQIRGSKYHPEAERDMLLVRVNSLLEYFTIRAAVLQTAEEMQEEPARMIGFEPPQR